MDFRPQGQHLHQGAPAAAWGTDLTWETSRECWGAGRAGTISWRNPQPQLILLPQKLDFTLGGQLKNSWLYLGSFPSTPVYPIHTPTPKSWMRMVLLRQKKNFQSKMLPFQMVSNKRDTRYMSEGHFPRSFSALGSLSVSQVPSTLSGSFKEQYVQNKGENNTKLC